MEDANLSDVEPIDMHKRMVFWFMWAFWSAVGPLCMVPVTAIFFCINQGCGKFFSGLTSILSVVSSLAVVITGMVWRWNVLGEVASGALISIPEGATEEQIATLKEQYELSDGTQWASGKFMNIYLLIVFWLTVVMLSCCAVGTIIACAKR